MLNPHFWKNKNVLITGHSGLKGSWLSIWLKKWGANVIGLSLDPPTTPSLFDLTQQKNFLHSYNGDIRNLSLINKIFDEWRPSIIFHLAAQPLVRESYRNPFETFTTNILGPLHLLEVISKHSSVKVFVNITSDKCYAPPQLHLTQNILALTETAPLGGIDPYSSSKACSEFITQSYYQSFWANNPNLGVATARAGNVLGGGDFGHERLIPDFIRATNSNKPLTLRYPKAIRPWQHILEVLSAYLLLAQKIWETPLLYSGAFNIAPPKDHHQTVEWVIQHLCLLFNRKDFYQIQTDPDDHKVETATLLLNGDKAHQMLGNFSIWTLERTLEQTASWYKRWRRGDNPLTLCLEQIEEYEKEFDSKGNKK